MPRHPPNALTSRLRTRTTNIKPDTISTKTKALARELKDQKQYRQSGIFTQHNQYLKHTPPPSSSRKLRKKMRPASISRTHSQCQRRRIHAPTGQAGSGSFISGNMCRAGALRLSAFGNFVLAMPPAWLRSKLVEPIGIEPMTSSLQS